MWWVVVVVILGMFILALVGGMGFFTIDPGDTDSRHNRGLGGNYIDWML